MQTCKLIRFNALMFNPHPQPNVGLPGLTMRWLHIWGRFGLYDTWVTSPNFHSNFDLSSFKRAISSFWFADGLNQTLCVWKWINVTEHIIFKLCHERGFKLFDAIVCFMQLPFFVRQISFNLPQPLPIKSEMFRTQKYWQTSSECLFNLFSFSKKINWLKLYNN